VGSVEADDERQIAVELNWTELNFIRK